MIINRNYLLELVGMLTLIKDFEGFTSEEVEAIDEFRSTIKEEIKEWNGDPSKDVLLPTRNLFVELHKKEFLPLFVRLKMCGPICTLGKLKAQDK